MNTQEIEKTADLLSDGKLDMLRHCIFRPYRPGQGPSFELRMWDTHKRDAHGRTNIGYVLTIRAHKGAKAVPLFIGDEFFCSPMHADDSDESVRGLMSFLTLKPGDTDAEFFEKYTPGQLAYCSAHAESLALEVFHRYGEDS